MRALNSSNIPSNLTSTSPSHPKDSSVSALASQFMDMFDPSKLDTTLLNKRPNPNLDHFELQKKLKTGAFPGQLTSNNMNNNMANLLFQQSMFNTMQGGMNFPMMSDGFSQDFAKLQQLQNLNLLLNLNKSQHQQPQPQIPTANPSLFTNPFLNKDALGLNLLKNFSMNENSQQQQGGLKIKEEFIKEEESVKSTINAPKKLKIVKPAPKEEVESNSTCTENGEDEEESVRAPFPATKEPALVLYTEAFPDWDLATIFMFLKSNKPQDVFEKERQIKLERKLKRRGRGERKEKVVKAKKPSKYDDLPKNARVTRRMQQGSIDEAGQVQQVQA